MPGSPTTSWQQPIATESVRYEASLRREPTWAAAALCQLKFDTATSQIIDLRDVLPGLQDHPDWIKPRDVVVDSDMSLSEAFQQLHPDCPDSVLAHQELMRVYYFGPDLALHQGQVVVHRALSAEVDELFELLQRERIPIGSMIPLADSRFIEKERWDDSLSMQANNGSAFNFRNIQTATGEQQRLSLHALGLALDLNPVWNPCYGAPVVHIADLADTECAAGYWEMVPPNGDYDLVNSGSFHNRHPVVVFLKSKGWIWGGEWGEPKDLHHFQKIPAELSDWAAENRKTA